METRSQLSCSTFPTPGTPVLWITLFALVALVTLLTWLPAAGAHAQEEPPRLDITTEVTLETDAPRPVSELYDELAAQAGLHLALDPELPPRELEIDLHAVPAPAALDRLTRSAGHFWVPLGPDSVFVTYDTPKNRRQHENLVIQAFQLENLNVRDALTVLRSLLGVKRIATVEPLNAIVVRDTAAKAAATARLLETIDGSAGALEVRVEVVTLDAGALGEHEDRPPRLATGEWRQLRAAGRPLASPWLGVGPGDDASFAMNLRPDGEFQGETGKGAAQVPGDLFHRLEVDLASRLHPKSGEVSLEVLVEWIQGHGEGADSQDRLAQRLRSTLRLEPGETYLLSAWEPVPALEGHTLVVALTPHLTTQPGLSTADLAPFWVGTEDQLRLPSAED